MQLFKIQKDLENHYRDMQVRRRKEEGRVSIPSVRLDTDAP